MTAAEVSEPVEEPRLSTFVKPRLLTVAEYLEIDEPPSGYAELTEGRVSVVPSAILDHNYAANDLRAQIKPQLPQHLLCVTDVDVDLELVPRDQPGFCRRPDVVVFHAVARERIRQEGGVLRASDVVVAVEVISRGSRRTDRVVKRGEYADAGIPHYWILDLTEPVSLLTLHLAGEIGYAAGGEHTGRVTLDEPFPVTLALDELR